MADFMMIDKVAPTPLGAFGSLYEMVEIAHSRMVKGEWERVAMAAGSGMSMRLNRLGFDSLAFRQRICRDVSELDLTTTLLGHKLAMPVMICPMGGLHTFVSPTAIPDAARAAADAGIPIGVSSAAEPSLETIAETGGDGLKFFQLFVRGDSDHVAKNIERAKAAGYAAIVITADAPYFSIRDYPNKSAVVRQPVKDSGKDFGAKVTWETLDEIKLIAAPLPVILKGVQTAEDAALAVEHGLDAIQVSNHGGRELDYVDATISMLPEIATAVDGAVPIILDSGIRRGTDVVKALALGATMVGIGRLMIWANAAGGEAGVARMLDLLHGEIGNAMGMLGVRNVAELDPSFLRPISGVTGRDVDFRLPDLYAI